MACLSLNVGLLLVFGLGLASCYVIDDKILDDSSIEKLRETARGEEKEKVIHLLEDEDAILAELRKLLAELKEECTKEAEEEVPKSVVDKKKAEYKKALLKDYMSLIHARKSYILDEVWREAKKDEKCTDCLFDKICESPPQIMGLPSNLPGKEKKLSCKKIVLKYVPKLHEEEEKKESCDDVKHESFRTIDGKCNNLHNPDWGKANTAFVRLQEADYADCVSAPRVSVKGKPLPNARLVSRDVHGSNQNRTNPFSKLLSHWVMTYGQFLDHDITLALAQGVNCEPPTNNPECVNIEIPEDDVIFRSRHVEDIELERDAPDKPHNVCALHQREHTNTLTAFIDASQVYGGSEEQSEELRDSGGTLKVMPHPHGCPFQKLLPRLPPEEFCVSKDPIRPCFLTGDERANENPALASIHTLLVREHNRIASVFAKITDWSPERIFEETRKIIGAILQHITYSEWLPELLGTKTLKTFGLVLQTGKKYFKGYDKTVNAQISQVFAVAAFRFGHTLVGEEFNRLSQDGLEHKDCNDPDSQFKPIPVLDFGNPIYLYEKCEGGIDAIWRGLARDAAGKADGKFSSSVQENLFRGPGDLSDLVAINLQRGRERGVPGYLTFRNSKLCHAPKVKTFDDLFKIAGFNEAVVDALKKLFKDPNDIDVFTGMLLEGHDPFLRGGVLGPTFQCLLGDQFRRLRIGDRFWYENEPNADDGTEKTAFNQCQLKELRKITFSKIICDNADDICAMPRRAFRLGLGDLTPCDKLPSIDLRVFTDTFDCKHEDSSADSAEY